MKRLGPELKMPELKAPTFLADLWWDLVDRRLLPLLALIVVATIAVPFLMGKSKEVPQTSLAALAATRETPLATSGGRDLAVVQAEPGLRDYRKRLGHLRPTDPFMQRFTAPANIAQLKVTSSTSTTSSTTSTTGGKGGEGGAAQTTSSGPASSGSPAPSGAPAQGKPHIFFFTFALNVEITRTKKEPEAGEKPETWVRNKVMPLTPLPGKERPVVTYMGLSKKGKVLLLVSREVASESGEGKCLSSGEEACQLIEVEPGFPETFVWGPNEVQYEIKVLSLKVVITHRT